jgi:glycerol-3-phosphate dehydrogenase
MAILNHLSKTHKSSTFYAYEKNKESLEYMMKNRKNKYFFTEEKISDNIELLEDINDILPQVDLIIIAIPNQFVKSFISEIKDKLKP